MGDESASSAERAGLEAATLFDKDGLFCAESVLAVLANRQGVPPEIVTAMATGFCGGVSRTGGMCGAVSGAIMALGLAYGRSSPDKPVATAYSATQRLMKAFADEFQSVNCADLLGCHLGTPEGRQTFNEQKLATRCLTYTRRATEIAAELIESLLDETPEGE